MVNEKREVKTSLFYSSFDLKIPSFIFLNLKNFQIIQEYKIMGNKKSLETRLFKNITVEGVEPSPPLAHGIPTVKLYCHAIN